MRKQDVRDQSIGKFTVAKNKICKIVGVSRNGDVFNFGLDDGMGVVFKKEHELPEFLESLSDGLEVSGITTTQNKEVPQRSVIYANSAYTPNAHMGAISDGLMKFFNALENSEGEELKKVTSKIETACLVSDAMVKMEMATIKGLGLINKV